MSSRTSIRATLGACVFLAAFIGSFATGALAATTTTTPTCNAPVLTQAYAWALDENWYAAIPGVGWDTFSSAGWTLSKGAKVIPTTLADGSTGAVLDLPSGSSAV